MITKEMTEYAARLDEIKARFRLKNTDLAKIAGVSDNSISKIMSGQTEAPDVRILASIARKFNISGNWLLLGEGSMLREEPEDSLRKGLQLRDEMIAQLQRELWGKSEGDIDEPLSNDMDQLLGEYKAAGLDVARTMLSPAKLTVRSARKEVAPRSFTQRTR